MENNKLVFHFTSMSAFTKIIKGGAFYLFDITKSNDPLEGKFVVNALKKAYGYLRQTEKITQSQYTLAHRAFFDFSETISAFGRLDDLTLSASFCMPVHELSLWRSYGDGGKGVAIGISPEKLSQFASVTKGMTFQKIKYLSQKEMEQCAKEFWMRELSEYKCSSEQEMENMEKLLEEKLREFYFDGYFIKHDANKDEEEYRLIYHTTKLSNYCIPSCGPNVDANIDFQATVNDLKAYYKIDIKKTEKRERLMERIFLGPLCRANRTEVSMFLSKYGVGDCTVLSRNCISMRE